MSEPDQGRAWVLGDFVDTGQIVPGHAMRKPLEELARHCLENERADFVAGVRRGDILVAGEGFGIGSSREQAPQALLHLGIRVVVARSFARIFYRNCFNLGLPAVICADAGRIRDGDRLRVDLANAVLENLGTGERLAIEPVPPFLLEMIAAGGLIPHLHAKLQRRTLS